VLLRVQAVRARVNRATVLERNGVYGAESGNRVWSVCTWYMGKNMAILTPWFQRIWQVWRTARLKVAIVLRC